ncbi:hypothetical protein GSY71_12100 [Pusillimonas sp. TS35]|nr:hypothetical protein [Pusillimonas sp. TS35]
MNKKEWVFADFHLDQQFTPFQYRIGAAESDDFIATFDHGPVLINGHALAVTQEPRNTVRSVHPTLVGSFQPQHAAFAWPTGVLHAREKISLSAPVYPGEMLEAHIKVKNKFVKNDKYFVVLEIDIRKLENDCKAMTVERTLVWPQ